MDNIVDWLTFGLSALCTVGSFWAWLQAKREKMDAAESERKVKEYAQNADAKNQSAKKYYDKILELTDTQTRALIFQKRYELLSEVAQTFDTINALLDENRDSGIETEALIDTLIADHDEMFEQESIEFRICVQSLCNRVNCLFNGMNTEKISAFLCEIYDCKQEDNYEDNYNEDDFINCYHAFAGEYNKMMQQTKL